MKVYADDPNRRFIRSAGGTFLLRLAAVCGYVRNRNNMKMLDGALDKLEAQLQDVPARHRALQGAVGGMAFSVAACPLGLAARGGPLSASMNEHPDA
jgi:hypothetical protein